MDKVYNIADYEGGKYLSCTMLGISHASSLLLSDIQQMIRIISRIRSSAGATDGSSRSRERACA